MKRKKIVILGGGTGTSAILCGLKYFPVDITAIITVSDNGRSTGRLREEFSMPAIGDIRKVISNLSTLSPELKSTMEYKISTYSDLNGHKVGNLLLTGLYQQTGSLKKSIEYMSKLMQLEHTVLPLSEDCLTLMAETIDGEIIEGEAEITLAKKQYKRLFYKNEPNIFPETIQSIKEADLIIISMGSLYTSVIPHLICKEIVDTINSSNAKCMYICNAMTQPGETDNFGVSDHVHELEKYLGKNTINSVIVSNTIIPQEVLDKYSREEEKDLVKIDYENIKKDKYEILEDNLLVIENGTIRHDSLKLSSIIFSYLMRD